MRLRFIIHIACLNLWRSWRATAVLSVMVVFAVAALVFLAALAIGTNDAMIRNSIGLFSGHIAGTGLPREMRADRFNAPGVAQVLVRRHLRLLVEKDHVFETIELIGVDPLQEKAHTALWKKTLAGRYLQPGEQALYLNRDTARRLQATVGNQLHLHLQPGKQLQTLTLAGIYMTGASHLDQTLAFCPAEVFPGQEGVTSAAVFLEDGASVDDILQQFRGSMPKATFHAWPDFMPDLKQLIDLNFVCMAIVMVLVFALVAVGISCAFLIFTLKGLREHGIMKAMGIMPLDTAVLLTTQIGVLTTCAATLGVVAGVALVAVFARHGIDLSSLTSHNQYFSVSGIIYPRCTAASLVTPPLLAGFFGMAAAIWPALFVMHKSPADILRSV
jgi:ABC-type lipoprotein release transport system permease subunit